MSDRLLGTSSTWLRVCSVLGLGLALAGCAAGGGWAAGVMVLMSLGALALSGCTASHGTTEDAGVVADGDVPSDAPSSTDAGGYWEPCCVDGAITTCFCPAGLACNYGWYEDCGGGTCAEPGTGCSPPS